MVTGVFGSRVVLIFGVIKCIIDVKCICVEYEWWMWMRFFVW